MYGFGSGVWLNMYILFIDWASETFVIRKVLIFGLIIFLFNNKSYYNLTFNGFLYRLVYWDL